MLFFANLDYNTAPTTAQQFLCIWSTSPEEKAGKKLQIWALLTNYLAMMRQGRAPLQFLLRRRVKRKKARPLCRRASRLIL